jgi:hypothetical protein
MFGLRRQIFIAFLGAVLLLGLNFKPVLAVASGPPFATVIAGEAGDSGGLGSAGAPTISEGIPTTVIVPAEGGIRLLEAKPWRPSQESGIRLAASSLGRGSNLFMASLDGVFSRLRGIVLGEEAKPAVVFTLRAEDDQPDSRGTLRYLIDYENRTKEPLREAIIKVQLPKELKYLDSDWRPTSVSNDEVQFSLAKLAAGEKGTIQFETRLKKMKPSQFKLTAVLSYLDASGKENRIRVSAGSEVTSRELRQGFLAARGADLGRLLFNPIFWLLAATLLFYFGWRYLRSAKRKDLVSRPEPELQPEQILGAPLGRQELPPSPLDRPF